MPSEDLSCTVGSTETHHGCSFPPAASARSAPLSGDAVQLVLDGARQDAALGDCPALFFTACAVQLVRRLMSPRLGAG